jgi:hypothetical protein
MEAEISELPRRQKKAIGRSKLQYWAAIAVGAESAGKNPVQDIHANPLATPQIQFSCVWDN